MIVSSRRGKTTLTRRLLSSHGSSSAVPTRRARSAPEVRAATITSCPRGVPGDGRAHEFAEHVRVRQPVWNRRRDRTALARGGDAIFDVDWQGPHVGAGPETRSRSSSCRQISTCSRRLRTRARTPEVIERLPGAIEGSTLQRISTPNRQRRSRASLRGPPRHHLTRRKVIDGPRSRLAPREASRRNR